MTAHPPPESPPGHGGRRSRSAGRSGTHVAEAGLAVAGATVRFGATTALDGVSLEVTPGEVLALLGPSGCGKSTLLRAVAGLQPLDAGAVRWAGADLAGVPVHRRGFGLMFQDGQLFVHRDVGGNVAFGLEMARVPREDRRERVADLLGLVGLGGYEGRAVATLSGGEQQRVALARSLAPRPRLLLLDEPLSALDRALRDRLAGELAAILRAAGTTALYVTHDHDEAFAVADRVAVMAAGNILQADAPARLWRSPASRTVAEFLGYEAFLPVTGNAPGGRGEEGRGDDGAPALLAIPPGAVRITGPTPVAGADVGEPSHAAALPGLEPEAPGAPPGPAAEGGRVVLAGVVLGRRTRRGGGRVDVRLTGREGSVAVVAAVDDADRAWEPGAPVMLALDLRDAVVVPPD